MKKELSPVSTGVIIAIVVVVLGGFGFAWFTKATGSTGTSKAEEQKAYEQAKSYYSDIGSKAPGSSRPGGNAEYEARMKQSQSQGQK